MGNAQSQDDSENFGIGIRVVRGPNWDWKEQDGGEGSLGVLRQFEGTQEVVVYWDMGSMGNYQFKTNHDLRIYDMAPCGIAHRVSCDVCDESPIVGLRWMCTVCDDYDLCSKCYHNDAHDTSHAFVCALVSWSRGEISGPVLPPREGSRKVALKGILPGAKVVRGMDWKWDQQDGGDGGVGEVQSLDNWKGTNDGVKVMWQQSKKLANYRIGCEGKTDLKLLEPPTETNSIYIDHLPVVDAALRDCDVKMMISEDESDDSDSDEEAEEEGENPDGENRAVSNPAVNFKIGDYVRLLEDQSAVQQLQRGHGGWSDDITPFLGKTGKVTFLINNVVGVNFGSLNKVFNPRALQHVEPPVDQFYPDDFVRLSSDCDLVRQLQSSLGGWVDKIEKVLGKVGRVMSVPANDRIVVNFHTAKYTLNAATVTRCEAPPSEIVTGDIVKVIDDLESVKVLQIGHGGWVEDMLKFLGKEGRCVRIDQDGDVRVHVDEQFLWFNPAALLKLKPAAEAGPLSPQEMEEIQNGVVQTRVTVGIHQLSDFFQQVLLGAAQMSAGEAQPTIPEHQPAAAAAAAPATTTANGGQVERQKGPSVVYVNERGGLARTISTEDGSNDEMSAMYKKIRELEEQINCKVCLSNRKEVVFQCGHGACEGCAERLDSCHICRKKILTRIRLFT